MGFGKVPVSLAYACGAAVVAVSVFGFATLLERPAIPWDEISQATGIPAAELPEAAVRIDGFEVRDPERDFYFAAARHRIGDPVEFVFRSDGGEVIVRPPLERFFVQGTFPTLYLLAGLFGFAIAFIVLRLRPGDPRARLLYWLTLTFSSAVMIGGDWYGVQGRAVNLLPGVLFTVAYALIPVLLLRFALSFSPPGRGSRVRGLLAVSVLLGAFFSAVLASAILLPSAEIFRLKRLFIVFRVFFAALCAAAIVHLFRALRAAESRKKKAQIKWVLSGLLAVLGPFLVLYQIPRALELAPLISEEAASYLFVLLPLFLAGAILKHRLMDIDVLLNRGLVYSFLTAATVGVYLLAAEILRQVFVGGARPGRRGIPVAAALVAAAFFAPARKRIQTVVDKAFFRYSRDYRRAVSGFAASAQGAIEPGELLSLLESALAEALPVERAGGLFFADPGGKGMPKAFLRLGVGEDAADSFPTGRPEPAVLWALETSVESHRGLDFGRTPLLRSAGYELAVPVIAAEGAAWGWILFGRKRSGERFTEEDLELLRTLVAELALALGRIRLQEEVIYERASREKAEELSRLKTEFISAVSHELRTPMTSLQGLSELLQSGKVRDKERRGRLLELMAGECGRLGRFLNNVLDYGRIEQGAKRYELRKTDLGPLVRETVELVRSAMGDEPVSLRAQTPNGPVLVEADPDAFRQALINLIDNAVKYSEPPKKVVVRLSQAPGSVELAVEDNGIGVPEGDRGRIFEAFFRSAGAVVHDPKGVGLGLKIVRHIMEAHRGSVTVRSEPGRGSTFTLRFPRGRKP